jgi:K+-sensing histidine kinase KdpD
LTVHEDLYIGLGKELGAEILTVAGQEVAQQLGEIAEQYAATRPIVGRSKQRGPFGRVRSLAEKMLDISETMDSIILSGKPRFYSSSSPVSVRGPGLSWPDRSTAEPALTADCALLS